MVEIVKSMTAGEFCGWATVAVIVVSGIVEFTPIKINPWSAIAKRLGKAMNGEVIAKVEKLERDIKTMQDTEDERAAKSARTRVLRFGDELIHDVRHSKEHFDDILQDISDYEKYCEEHPKFENDRMSLTAQLIKDTYCQCMKEHKFL